MSRGCIADGRIGRRVRPPLLAVAPGGAGPGLGDVAEVVNGAVFSSSRFNNEGRGEPLVRIRDVGGDRAQVHYDGPYEEFGMSSPKATC